MKIVGAVFISWCFILGEVVAIEATGTIGKEG